MSEEKAVKVEPMLFAVLASRLEAITKEMVNTLFRTGRSIVLNIAKDFSTGVCCADGRLLLVAQGLPVHVGAGHLVPIWANKLLGEDIHPGDLFLNNCPYYGNTHHADITALAPVFYKGERLFWSYARAHQADIGAPIPTTYLPFAKDIYEEGMHFPCVRVQRNYKDIEDIIRMAKTKIRVPEQWYGDYLAQVSSVRTGEKRLIEVCDKYGADLIKMFVDEWFNYGERRMVQEIRKLPKGTWEYEVKHDPLPPLVPDGIPIKVKLSIDPYEGYIDVDLTENPDCLPCGLNMSECTAIAAAVMGVLYNLDPSIPHNHGSFSRIRTKLRENCCVGGPRYPAGTSCATSNLAHRVNGAVASAFGLISPTLGVAEGSGAIPSLPVIAGVDSRTGASFVNELILARSGGPPVYGADGFMNFVAIFCPGCRIDSLEIDEQKFPIIYEHAEFVTDRESAGQWIGGPFSEISIKVRQDPVTFAAFADGEIFPPKGIHGGYEAKPMYVYKITAQGERVKLAGITESVEILQPGEKYVCLDSIAGGYGDPLDRDPERVMWNCREGLISVQRAHDVYGVVLDTTTEQYQVDHEGTRRLRELLKGKRSETK